MFSPKIVAEGAEGGTAMFELKYFENKAYLAQSPQFYKQMLVGAGYERVFEVGHVYRAEEHNTPRHLNEYISLDLEMGFIEDERDIMELETELLRFMLSYVKEECKRELEILKVELPEIKEFIPSMKLSEAIEILKDAADKELTSGRGPTGVAAASIYIASILCGERRTQREVADVAGVTEVTIRNRYKELAERLDIDIIL